jgi:hypothetical protein
VLCHGVITTLPLPAVTPGMPGGAGEWLSQAQEEGILCAYCDNEGQTGQQASEGCVHREFRVLSGHMQSTVMGSV